MQELTRAGVATSLVGFTALLGGCILGDPGAGPPGGATAADVFDARHGDRLNAPAPGTAPDGRTQVTLREISAWTSAFADRWASLISDATDRSLAEVNPGAPVTIEQRAAVQRLRVASITSVYDIASNPDPLAQLLEMVVFATLEKKVWVDEGWGDELLGPRGAPLTNAITALHDDIWLTSINAMNGAQTDYLQETIQDWRDKNPDVRAVEWIRLGEFAGGRGEQLVADIKSSGFLAPLDDATKAIEEVRRLGERGIWLGTRAPMVLSWQADALVDQVLAKPEVQRALADSRAVAESVERVSDTAAQLPERIKSERVAIIAALDEREAKLDGSVRELRATIADGEKFLTATDATLRHADSVVKSAQDLSHAMTQTVNSVDRVVARFDKPAPGVHDTNSPSDAKPFDIAEYTRAVEQLSGAVKELNGLVGSVNGLMASPAWTQRLDDLDRLSREQLAEAERRGVKLSNAVFWRTVGAIGAFFVGLCAWTLLRWKLK